MPITVPSFSCASGMQAGTGDQGTRGSQADQQCGGGGGGWMQGRAADSQPGSLRKKLSNQQSFLRKVPMPL